MSIIRDIVENEREVMLDNGMSKAIGNINSPLLDLPLNNSLAMKQGVGSVEFTRSTTATYIDRYGVLQTAAVDEPRFEKDGLLIEGSSTNLCLYSNDLTDDSWLKSAGGDGEDPIITANYGISPDGTQNSTRVQLQITDDTDSANYSNLERALTDVFTDPSNRTISVWVRSTDGGADTTFALRDYHGTDTNIHITATSEWQRVELVRNNIESDDGRIIIHCRGEYGTDTTVDIELFGFQYEELPFASSYIPTTDSAVTRGVDVCNATYRNNCPAPNTDEMSVLCDVSFLGRVGNQQRPWRISGETNRLIQLVGDRDLNFYYGSTPRRVTAEFNKIIRTTAIFNKTTMFHYKNGSMESPSIAPGTVTGNASGIGIGCDGGGSSLNSLFGHIKNFRVYDRALTEQEVRLA